MRIGENAKPSWAPPPCTLHPPILFVVADCDEAKRLTRMGLKAVAAVKTAPMIGLLLAYDVHTVVVCTRSILDDPQPPLVRYCDSIIIVAEWNLRHARTREELIHVALGGEVPVAAAEAA